MEPRKAEEIIPKPLAECHGGVGTLMCKSLLENLGSEGLDLMHRDDIPAGVSIGFHEHTANEEVYYLASGSRTFYAIGRCFADRFCNGSLPLLLHFSRNIQLPLA